jgi:hypothetical protein
MMPEEEPAGLSHEITTRFTGSAATKLFWQHVGEPNPAEVVVAQLKERLDRLEQGLARSLAIQEEILQAAKIQSQTLQRIEAATSQPAGVKAAPERAGLSSRTQLHTIVAIVITGGLIATGYWAYTLLFA